VLKQQLHADLQATPIIHGSCHSRKVSSTSFVHQELRRNMHMPAPFPPLPHLIRRAMPWLCSSPAPWPCLLRCVLCCASGAPLPLAQAAPWAMTWVGGGCGCQC
jgi:hypothetical protein